MTREGGGWPDGGDQTWSGGQWDEAPGREAWSDTTPDPGGWYDEPQDGGWGQPTEQAPRTARWPFVLAAVLGVVVIGLAATLGMRLAGRGDTGQGVDAATTSSAWSTARSSARSTPSAATSASQVTPAGGGSRSSSCTKDDLERDSGWGEISYLDCYGDWAVVRPRAGTGDGGVFRLVNGAWTPTRYGPSSCIPPGSGAELPDALKREHLHTCASTDERRTSVRRPSSSAVPRPTSSERPAPPPPPAPEPPPPPPPPPAPEPTIPEPTVPEPTETTPVTVTTPGLPEAVVPGEAEDAGDTYGEGVAGRE